MLQSGASCVAKRVENSFKLQNSNNKITRSHLGPDVYGDFLACMYDIEIGARSLHLNM